MQHKKPEGLVEAMITFDRIYDILFAETKAGATTPKIWEEVKKIAPGIHDCLPVQNSYYWKIEISNLLYIRICIKDGTYIESACLYLRVENEEDFQIIYKSVHLLAQI